MSDTHILNQLKESHSIDRREILTTYIRELLVEFMELDEIEEIEVDQDFIALGISSMEAIDFKSKLEEELDCLLKTTLFFDYPNMQLLVTYLLIDVLEMDAKSIRQKNVDEIVNEATSSKEKETSKEQEAIAIIAMEGIFPGVTDIEHLWKKSITETISDRLEEDMQFRHLSTISFSSVMESIQISVKEYENMNRQQQLIYQCIANAMHRYKILLHDFSTKNTGVFIGYQPSTCDTKNNTDIAYQTPLSNDISFRLNLKGPSEIVNTFCTSVYVALHRAIQSIRLQESDQAIVGGVNVISEQEFKIHSENGLYKDLLSPKNITKSFSEDANGFVRSEGAGVVILKRLSQAVKDKNTILAVLKSTTVFHGGKNFSLEAPNAQGIKNTIKSCIKKSGITTDSIDYIEAHGIANHLADAIELTAIHDAYTSLSTIPDKKWHISTIKPVIGHPELAAGIASLIKTIKALNAKIIPGIVNFSSANTEIPSNNTLLLHSNAVKWDMNRSDSRKAALNSYAIGGVNAHVILEEYIPNNESSEILTKKAKEESFVTTIDENTEHTIATIKQEQEATIASIINEVFELEYGAIDPSLSPVDYGFDSIKIVQFVRRLNELLKIDIKIGQVLGMNNFEEFFTMVATSIKIPQTVSKTENTPLVFNPEYSSDLTMFQKGLWLIHELDSTSTTYNLPIIFSTKKAIKPHFVLQALALMLEEYPVLRVYFEKNEVTGEISQKLHNLASCLIIDIASISDEENPNQEFKKLLRIPFNLNTDCLIRLYIRECPSKKEEYLIFIIHHTILDGLSGTLFMKSFWDKYHVISTGKKYQQQEPDTAFFDFVLWEKQYMGSEQAVIDIAWWKEKLNDKTPLLLPYDHQKNTYNTTQEKQNQSIVIEGDQLIALKTVAKSLRVNLSVVLLSAFKILLHKLTLQDDIIVATPVEGRIKKSYENSIGCFVNVILTRSKINKEHTIKEVIQEIKKAFLDGLDHSNYPLTSLLADLGMVQRGDTPSEMMIPVSFTYQNIFDHILDESLSSKNVTPIYDIYQETQDNYALEVYDFRTELQINLKYKPQLFEESTISRHLKYFDKLIDTIINSSDILLKKYKLLSNEEEEQFLKHFDKTQDHYPIHKTIVDLFEEQVIKTPNHSAVTYKEQQCTYNEINIRANKLAQYLRKQGVAKESMVVVCIDRSIEMIVSIFAILKAGGIYVPVDPDYPIERIRYTIEDANPILVICNKKLKEKLEPIIEAPLFDCVGSKKVIDQETSENLNITIEATDLAYVIYTSGTTGKPKGVLVSHHNVVRLLKPENSQFDFNDTDVWTLFHSYCFDFSVWEIYGALLFGGRLVIVPVEICKDAIAFGELLQKEGITILNQTPSAFYILQEHIDLFVDKLDVRYVIFGGESLQPAMLKKWHTIFPNCKLINMYGITETTVHVTYKEIGIQEIISGVSTIGVPIPTLSCYVMNEEMQLLPQGVVGELYVGGEGVARGYLNRPELTTRRFVDNPYSKQSKLYKTGDVVRWGYDNTLEYLGRVDDQVKIRGYRIELREIENVIIESSFVRKCIVIASDDSNGYKKLIAYIVLEKNADIKSVQKYLKQYLPEYMIPASLVVVEELPLTSNGKIDKKALPSPDSVQLLSEQYVAATSETERLLVSVWEEVLTLERIGVFDDFFELGGHSLLVIKAITEINKVVEIQLKAQHIFQFPTVHSLATYIDEGDKEEELLSLEDEIDLVVNQQLISKEFKYPNAPEHIFITGATGFVGVFLLKELLEKTTATIHCLTRANSNEAAYQKIKNGMLHYNLWADEYVSRIQVIIGDISLPLLGLDQTTFDLLSQKIEMIYHNAAHMNHLATYDMLKPANVNGAVEIVKLATQTRIKPIQYTSTLAVFNNTTSTVLKTVTEQTISSEEVHYKKDGYATSKWVAENLMIKARELGVPCTIYRLGLTTGDTVDGRQDHKQWFYGLIKCYLLMGAMINEELDLALPIMPVDTVVTSLVYLSQQEELMNNTFHLSGNPSSLYKLFKEYNHINTNSLKEVSLYDWLQLAKLYLEQDSTLPIPPFMHDYLELSKEELVQRMKKELTAKLNFDTTYTQLQLESIGISFSTISKKTMLAYFNYVVEKEKLNHDKLKPIMI
ncbi:non-ribosomal peptide synthetase [Aquimarina longa]|uniref:non-ribosomal peptide synthetase n=1 Tax=Aquimarina longa TaxID=1080221 RepID=UPI000781BCCF|nr:non-ribosomal peptide synthetase [Aquimarina longa]